MARSKKTFFKVAKPKKEIIRSVRYTPEEDALLDAKCAKTGLPKSVLIHDTSLGYDPPQLMTDEQEEALKSLSAARSELVGMARSTYGTSRTLFYLSVRPV